MSSVARSRPACIPDLSGLAIFLALAGYNHHARGVILEAASREGTAAGVPEVDPGDEPEVERLIEEGFAPGPAYHDSADGHEVKIYRCVDCERTVVWDATADVVRNDYPDPRRLVSDLARRGS